MSEYAAIVPRAFGEKYSCKVCFGPLEQDTSDDELRKHFERFGRLQIDWPQEELNSSPRGHALLLFFKEKSVHKLVKACVNMNGVLFYVGFKTPTQIQPWQLTDCDFESDPSYTVVNKRMTIFVKGLPRYMTAHELSDCMSRNFGAVLYAGINIDTRYLSPIGTARVTFLSYSSYFKALSNKQLDCQHGSTMKTLSMRPYVLSDQVCDECHGVHSTEKFASWFCGNLMCLKYYCTHCWEVKHSEPAYRGGNHFRMPTVVVPCHRSPQRN